MWRKVKDKKLKRVMCNIFRDSKLFWFKSLFKSIDFHTFYDSWILVKIYLHNKFWPSSSEFIEKDTKTKNESVNLFHVKLLSMLKK